jgi:hypothetical protein
MKVEPRARGPASANLQGRKPRDVGQRGASDAMGDFGADEERGRACWGAVDVLGEFVLSIGVGRSSIGSGDRSTKRLSVVARRRAWSLLVESLRSRSATLECHRKLI